MTFAGMFKTTLLSAALLGAGSANATFLNTGSIGGASVDDVTLAGDNADKLAYSTLNPATFSLAFWGSGSLFWSKLETVDSKWIYDHSSRFDFTFGKDKAGKTGTWSITNASTRYDATLDLALDLHSASASTAFLFDTTKIAAGQTLSGTWDIEWLNSNGKIPSLSYAVLYGRDLCLTTAIPAVPEPATLPMLAGGLALLAFAARRKTKK